uniref:Kinesin motor domain-containing protein n=1 Tax=Gasterosteus aculeatus aculeatus TaxID=481459 RepID=G3NLF3_GASAC
MASIVSCRAAEKLNLTSRKRGQASDPAPALSSTCFRELIQKTPPPVPPCLLQAATRTRDSPAVAKVHSLAPNSSRYIVGRFGFCAICNNYSNSLHQAEVCAGVLPDVIRCVLSGSDGCVLGLGCADVGSWSSMVGSGESIQKVGLLPCAISWLYSAIERRRERTWTDLTVSVSAIELCCGEEDTVRDLLGEVVPSVGSVQDSPKTHIRPQEDPVHGIQLRNHNRVKAPTAERAASLLDAAIAARRHNDFITYLSHSSIMFFTLHVQPPRTESSTIGKGTRGPTKLTLIDVCSGMRGMSKNKPPYYEMGPVVLSLLSGPKASPAKASKLTMLLREALSHVNCHTRVIAEVDDSMAHLQETLSTIQLASRIRRTQKRTKSTSCSPCGRSLTKERGAPSSSLRAFHSTDEVDADVPRFRLRGEQDEHSSSDQSCDTVIQIDSDGLVHPKATSRLAQPEFVPIIPSLIPNKLQGEKKNEENVPGNIEVFKSDIKQPGRDCFKCDTFAELQERLGCIDGSEAKTDVLKSSSKGPSVDNVTARPQPQKEEGKQRDSKSSDAQHKLLSSQGSGCSRACVGEKPTDGAFPGDSFQREDSGLYDCEECSATSSSEELLNQTLSFNVTCCSELPKNKTLKSADKPSSRSCKVEAQGTAVTDSAPLPKRTQESREAADWFKPNNRTSPIGKSSPTSTSSSCSSSHSLAASVVVRDVKEMMATITVTVQQPLDLKGQDELVFSMVEEVTISGALDRGRAGGNIICIKDTTQSQAHVQGFSSCQPIRIISNVSEETAVAGSSYTNQSSVAQSVAADTDTPQYQSRGEKRFLPSFINHMLIDTDVDCEIDGLKEKESSCDTFTEVRSQSALRGNSVRCPEDRKALEKRSDAFTKATHGRRPDKACDTLLSQSSFDLMVLEDSAFRDETGENQMRGKRLRQSDKSLPEDREHVYYTNTPTGSERGETISRRVGNAPKRIGVSPGCQETATASFNTGSLPRAWQNANHPDRYQHGHMADNRRDPRGVTSSNPCSPGATLERRQGRQRSPADHSLHVSSPRKYGKESKQHPGSGSKSGVDSLSETSNRRNQHDYRSGRPKSPIEDSGRLFSAKLEQLATRTNSLGRTPRDFPNLNRGSSNTSMSSKGSSKASTEGPVTHSARHTHSKLSAVGKLKMATPKVRRLSAPSTKNLSLPHKGLQQSIKRSPSLSPDCKTVSFERTSSFLLSSPTRSFHSISRTPSQSSTGSSTKSAIQGFANGRISDLLKETASSPPSGGLEQITPLPSPYSRVTAPRTPDHLSGYASDTTSVLSGDLPPAMGKTSLNFSNRDSTVSSGYDSMLRDSEATGSTISNRDSASNRSSSLLIRRISSVSLHSLPRPAVGPHQRRLSHDAPLSLRRSASGPQSGRADRGTPEAYEIKVYEIDNVLRMQKRAGAEVKGHYVKYDLYKSLFATNVKSNIGPTDLHTAFSSVLLSPCFILASGL